MAFFKFRQGGDDRVAAAAQPESIEVMRRRARHRLIGAGVLVLVAVIGFPLLFDTQPRPIAVDIPIDIPDRTKTKPLAIPAPPPVSAAVSSTPATNVAPAAQAPVAAAPAAPAPAPEPKVTTAASLDAKEQVVTSKPEPKPEPKPAAKPEAKPVPKVEAKAENKPDPKPSKVDDGAKARALLEGKPVEEAAARAPAAAEGRFVVQIGAFAESSKAQEARQKVERAGMKTYTQVAETKDGKRIRVRVGPYTNRAEAEKAAGKIKGLDLPANILTL